jgi:uncharacterized protein YndB with AHSA1/START domain
VRVTATTAIACPPERVFDTLADMRNELQWNSQVSKVELASAEPIGRGSRFELVNGGRPYDVTITTFEPPSRLVFEAQGKPDLTVTYALTPAAGGTELLSDLDFRPTGALKVVFTLLAPVIRRNVPKQYARLKALCESAPG